MQKILAINGSYRNDGITDQTLSAITEAAKASGAKVEIVLLREYPIEFCHNCRECTQQTGNSPGTCIIQDNMHALIDKIEQADAYILASPTNFGSVTAIFKRFMERLTPFAYWPWGMNAPQLRKTNAPRKKALLVSSCAAPGILGRWLYNTRKQLNMTAKVIGADTVATIFTGLVAQTPQSQLSEKTQAKVQALATKLI